MNKIKNYYTRTTRMLFAAVLLSFSLLAVYPANKVSAEEPGCYEPTSTTSGEYEEVTCWTEGAARAVSQFDACFVPLFSANGVTPQERDCDNLTQPGDRVPESGSTSNGGNQAFEPAEIDCEGDPQTGELNRGNCGIINYLVIAINFLSALAIMAIVASVMFAGYQYMSARDNPGAVSAAKKRIVWALVALALFVFGYGLLNFLVPGGVL